MNTKRVFISAFLFAVMLAIAASNNQSAVARISTTPRSLGNFPSVLTASIHTEKALLSSSYVDIDGDGKKERVDIRMISGKLLEAEEESCLGFRKYEGRFSIAVWVAGRPVEQSLNALWGKETEEMFFHAAPFRLGFRDYNHDSQPDFNIGQYENCNGWTYKLFTIARDGRVKPLKIEGVDGGLYVQAFDNSTAEIKETRLGFSKKEYSNGDDSCMPCLKFFIWDKEKQVFKLSRKIPAKD